jgi:hypothetical protein
MFVNDELTSVWKEAVLSYLKILFRDSLGETEEDHRDP